MVELRTLQHLPPCARTCGLSHGLHGQCREPVGDHAADDEEGEGGGLQDVDARLHAKADHKGAIP